MTKLSRIIASLLAALTFVALPALTGCTSGGPPAGEPSVRGVITETSEGTSSSFRVVWSEDLGLEKAEYDAAQVTLLEGAKVGGKVSSASELREGMLVEAWFEGPVAESYPVQAGASYVRVTGTWTGDMPTPPGLEAPQQ